MNLDLFESSDSIDRVPAPGARETIGPQSVVLRGLARERSPALLAAVDAICAVSPLRRMMTPGGLTMSVAMTNCGELGWITDRRGYRYAPIDPATGERWPAMPAVMNALARRAAGAAGFDGFAPDACLINCYEPGSRLSLHQDRDERDLDAPIVSVSLGLPAVFQFGGARRCDPVVRVRLEHGDVVVWGGVDRLRHHGVLRLAGGDHPLAGRRRLNLTFRKAG